MWMAQRWDSSGHTFGSQRPLAASFSKTEERKRAIAYLAVAAAGVLDVGGVGVQHRA